MPRVLVTTMAQYDDAIYHNKKMEYRQLRTEDWHPVNKIHRNEIKALVNIPDSRLRVVE